MWVLKGKKCAPGWDSSLPFGASSCVTHMVWQYFCEVCTCSALVMRNQVGCTSDFCFVRWHRTCLRMAIWCWEATFQFISPIQGSYFKGYLPMGKQLAAIYTHMHTNWVHRQLKTNNIFQRYKLLLTFIQPLHIR